MAIKPSPRFALLLLCMHTIASLVVYVTVMPRALSVTIISLIAISLIYHLARDVFLLLSNSWRDVSFDQGLVQVVVRDGSSFRAQVTSTTIVSPYFIIFRVRLDGFRLLVSRVIFPDALNAGEFRELCVGLRFASRKIPHPEPF
ncbi:MAG: protein YgfX [Gallionella sp.]